MSTFSEFDPSAFQRELGQVEAEAARLEAERSTLAKSVKRLARQRIYVRLARWIRSPRPSVPAYSLALLAIGPLVLGVVVLVLLSWLFGNWSIALGSFLVAWIAGGAGFASLLYYPADSLLPAATEDIEAKLRVETARLCETTSAVTELNRRLAALHEQRRELAKSDKLQRAMLLQRNWKSLRGSEWEDYVVEVCRTLGANVQRGEKSGMPPAAPHAPATGARGVTRREPTTLFVTFSPRRIAVAAVSEMNPFHPAAVRQVIDDLAQKGCDELGIITNARITAGSKELARSRHCTLVGEEEFPDFVLGKSPL
jgi:Restriction endonuclease